MVKDVYIELVEMHGSTSNSGTESIYFFKFKRVVRALQLWFWILLLSWDTSSGYHLQTITVSLGSNQRYNSLIFKLCQEKFFVPWHCKKQVSLSLCVMSRKITYPPSHSHDPTCSPIEKGLALNLESKWAHHGQSVVQGGTGWVG